MGLGSLYVNSFNAVRPALAGQRPARGDLPQPARGHQPARRSATSTGRWSRWARWSRSARSAARSASPAITSTRPRRSPATSQRRQHGRHHRRAINKLTDANLPLSMKAEWTEVMFLQIRAEEKNPAAFTFMLSAVAVFLALAALYESWLLPLAVILVVPMCLLCSLGGVLGTGRDVNIFVQIGLVVLVGPGVQERDPDRRVRQGEAPRGLVAGRRDRGGLPAPAAADPDDLDGVHHRRDPAGAGHGRRLRRCGGRWGSPCSTAWSA